MHVIDNIRTNKELASYHNGAPIYVSGNQYSRMGPFSHIEFLSEYFVVRSVINLTAGFAFTIQKILEYKPSRCNNNLIEIFTKKGMIPTVKNSVK